MVNVATVPETSASRSASIWSMAWQFRQARVGGRWRNPQAQAAARREGVLPLLGPVHHRRAGSLRVGTSGRFPPHLPAPGQEARIGQVVPPGRHLLGHRGHSRVGTGRAGPRPARRSSAGRRRRHRRPATHRDDLTRPRPLEHVAQSDAGLRRAEVATVAVRSEHAVAAPSPPATALTARTCRPAPSHGTTSPRRARRPSTRRRRRPRGPAGRRGPRRTAPPTRGSRPHPARASDRGTRRWPTSPMSSATAPSGAHTKAARRRHCPAPPPSRPVPCADRRRPPTVARARPLSPGTRPPRIACSSDPTAERRRAGKVVGAAAPSPARAPRAPSCRAGLVEIRRVRRGEEQVLHGSGPRAHGQRATSRLDPEGRGVLVVGGDGARAAARPCRPAPSRSPARCKRQKGRYVPQAAMPAGACGSTFMPSPLDPDPKWDPAVRSLSSRPLHRPRPGGSR